MASDSELLAELVALLPHDGRSPIERYQDFRKVFGTVEGKRVLREILSWGGMIRAPILGKPIDPYAMAVAFGERNMALKLMAAVYVEPTDKPQRAQRKKP